MDDEVMCHVVKEQRKKMCEDDDDDDDDDDYGFFHTYTTTRVRAPHNKEWWGITQKTT